MRVVNGRAAVPRASRTSSEIGFTGVLLVGMNVVAGVVIWALWQGQRIDELGTVPRVLAGIGVGLFVVGLIGMVVQAVRARVVHRRAIQAHHGGPHAVDDGRHEVMSRTEVAEAVAGPSGWSAQRAEPVGTSSYLGPRVRLRDHRNLDVDADDQVELDDEYLDEPDDEHLDELDDETEGEIEGVHAAAELDHDVAAEAQSSPVEDDGIAGYSGFYDEFDDDDDDGEDRIAVDVDVDGDGDGDEDRVLSVVDVSGGGAGSFDDAMDDPIEEDSPRRPAAVALHGDGVAGIDGFDGDGRDRPAATLISMPRRTHIPIHRPAAGELHEVRPLATVQPIDVDPMLGLDRLRGLGATMQRRLSELGYPTQLELAAIDDAILEDVAADLGTFPSRLTSWVAQARHHVDRMLEREISQPA